jgi:hypothetical protein
MVNMPFHLPAFGLVHEKPPQDIRIGISNLRHSGGLTDKILIAGN